jgi:hypothetical protein
MERAQDDWLLLGEDPPGPVAPTEAERMANIRSALVEQQRKQKRHVSIVAERLVSEDTRKMPDARKLAASQVYATESQLACRPIVYAVMLAAFAEGRRRECAAARLQAQVTGNRARLLFSTRTHSARTIRAAMHAHHRRVRPFRAVRAATVLAHRIAVVTIALRDVDSLGCSQR